MNEELQTPPTRPDPNIVLSGDEARLLMMTLVSSKVSAPTSMAITLYVRLNEISFAQPPK